jgi:hypothetical protein
VTKDDLEVRIDLADVSEGSDYRYKFFSGSTV